MSNPLIQAYRKPKVYVTLPSGGKYYQEKPHLSVDNELAIYPMTARDELLTKNPDALFNGESTMALLKSCCPDIPNPHDVPICDLAVILIAIRQASYGDNIDFDIKCPECEELNMLSLSIPGMLSTVGTNENPDICELDGGFKVRTKPYNIDDRTSLQIQQVKQQKMVEALVASDISDEEREKQFGEMFVSIANLTIKLIRNSIRYVETPDGERVEDNEMIEEWLQTISKKDYEAIKSTVEKLSESGINNKFNARCTSCSHEWETPVELDAANFFEG